MACKGQIEAHVYYVMEARNLMREADTPGLLRSRRLEILNDAMNLINVAGSGLGQQSQPIKELRAECSAKFLEVCDHAGSLSGL